MSSDNPYSAPSVVPPEKPVVQLPPADLKKVEAIIKDANQVWLAIVLCILCSALAAVIIPIWYVIRLVQHSSMANKYPELAAAAPSGSLPQQFQSAKIKLIIGIAISCVIAMLVLGSFVVLLLVEVPQ